MLDTGTSIALLTSKQFLALERCVVLFHKKHYTTFVKLLFSEFKSYLLLPLPQRIMKISLDLYAGSI